MKLKKLILIMMVCISQTLYAQDYDLVIVGGTPGGIMAAIEAARMGKTAVILERTPYIGGLPANGLDNQTPQDILDADLYFIDRIGLRDHLSPTRSNGLLAMVKQMRMYALALR